MNEGEEEEADITSLNLNENEYFIFQQFRANLYL
jgi:hypothetical protein